MKEKTRIQVRHLASHLHHGQNEQSHEKQLAVDRPSAIVKTSNYFKHRTMILVGLRIIRTVFHGNQHFFNRIRRWGLPSSLDMLLHGCITCNSTMQPHWDVSCELPLLFDWDPIAEMRIPSYDFAFPYCHPTLKFRKGSLAGFYCIHVRRYHLF